MWFNELVGFKELSPEQVRKNIEIEGNMMTSKVNGKSFQFGHLEIPTLEQLRLQTSTINFEGQMSINEVVGNVQELHCDPVNKHVLFQAASQFNLLEMVTPQVTPEQGIDIYAHDYTQGPACAIACGAGTIYRNYFVPLNGQVGQSSSNQIDCLELIGKELNNKELLLWKMSNGYALVNQQGLLNINSQLSKLSYERRELLKGKLKIGIQWDTQVTIIEHQQIVTQVYCSALPLAYLNIEPMYWESFARLILEATYEATLHTALLNLKRTGSNKVYLTLVGGGSFRQ